MVCKILKKLGIGLLSIILLSGDVRAVKDHTNAKTVVAEGIEDVSLKETKEVIDKVTNKKSNKKPLKNTFYKAKKYTKEHPWKTIRNVVGGFVAFVIIVVTIGLTVNCVKKRKENRIKKPERLYRSVSPNSSLIYPSDSPIDSTNSPIYPSSPRNYTVLSSKSPHDPVTPDEYEQ